MNRTSQIIRSSSKLVAGIAVLLMIPLVAMQFSSEVVWTLSDFIFAFALFFSTGMLYILVAGSSKLLSFKFAVGFSLFSGLFLIWANGAVGIVGTENNDFNLLYFIVIAVGLIGATLSRFKAKGLSFTMFAMASTQFLLGVLALLMGMAKVSESSVIEIISVHGFFITIFVLSALLFRNAAKDEMFAIPDYSNEAK